MEQLLTLYKLPCKSSGQCFQADSFLISGTSPGSPTHSPDIAVPDYFLWGYVKSKVYETCPANIDDLKYQTSVFKGSPRQCYNMLRQPFHRNCKSVLTTWWSKTKCHIQTVMTQMNSHGHGMHLIVLIKFFRFVLQSYFHFINCLLFLMHLVLKRPGPDAVCHATEERE
jgi:hypothetical protein